MTFSYRWIWLLAIVALSLLQSGSRAAASSLNTSSDRPVSVDWTPVIAAAAGQPFDTVSTMRFLRNGSGCVEANDRYWGHDGFTPASPDVSKMWREKAIIIAAAATTTWAAGRLAKQRPGTKTATAFKWLARGLGYGAAVRGGFSAVRNVAHCGW